MSVPELLGPLTIAAPVRRPGTVRRTSNLDCIRVPDDPSMWSVRRIRGGGRDLLTADHGSLTLDQARFEVEVDTGSAIVSIGAGPHAESLAALVGARVGFGFRSQVKPLLQQLGPSLLALLVDDLSGATAPAGYAAIRERALSGTPELPRPPPGAPSEGPTRLDVCAGWREGGLASSARVSGERVPFREAPLAPPVGRADDSDAWHGLEPLEAGWTRRLRRLDVTSEGATLAVDAMFRDTSVDPDGTERVVHEYALTATLDADQLVFVAARADPRALPFPTDCPAAAASASVLVGQPLAGLRRAVPRLASGPSSCTHLNDLMRSLADIEALVHAGALVGDKEV